METVGLRGTGRPRSWRAPAGGAFARFLPLGTTNTHYVIMGTTVSLTQIRPLLLAAGATEAQLDAAGPMLADPTQWFPGWGLMCVRGRAPAV